MDGRSDGQSNNYIPSAFYAGGDNKMWSRWSFWKHSFAFFYPSIPPSLTHSINVTMMNQWSEIGSIRTALLRLMLAKIIKEYQSNKNVSLLRFLTYDKNCDCKRSICGSKARFLSHVDNETFIIIASTFKLRLSLRWKACHCEDFFPPCKSCFWSLTEWPRLLLLIPGCSQQPFLPESPEEGADHLNRKDVSVPSCTNDTNKCRISVSVSSISKQVLIYFLVVQQLSSSQW